MLQPSPTKSTVKAVVKSPTKRVEFKKTKRDYGKKTISKRYY